MQNPNSNPYYPRKQNQASPIKISNSNNQKQLWKRESENNIKEINSKISKRDSDNKRSADSTEIDIIQDLSFSPNKLSPRSVKKKKGIKIDCSNMSKAQVKQIKRDNLRQKDKNNI